MRHGSSTGCGRRGAGGRPTARCTTSTRRSCWRRCSTRLRDRVGFDPDDVDDVVVGNGNSAGDQGMCIGRMAVLAAGWPVEAPGITLNRFCGSGQQAVTFAAMGIQAGHQDLVVGAGVEMMSRWPVEQGAVDFSAGNPGTASAVPAGAPGRLGRPDRDHRGVRPRRRRRLRARQPAAGRFRDGGRPFRPQRGADPQRRRFRRPRSRRVPSSRHDARRSGQAHAVVRGDGTGRVRGLRQPVRRDVPPGLPRGRVRRARAPRRQLVGRGRRSQRVGAGVTRVRQGQRATDRGRGS